MNKISLYKPSKPISVLDALQPVLEEVKCHLAFSVVFLWQSVFVIFGICITSFRLVRDCEFRATSHQQFPQPVHEELCRT